MAKYATGKYAKAISDRSGLEFPYTEMVREWNGSLVHISEFEPKQPQLEPKPMNGDAISLRHVRPGRNEPAVAAMLGNNPFSITASSQTITVTEPNHGRSTSDTVRFRDAIGFDGFTATVLNNSSGYAITKVDDNTYTFTASSGTATTGGIRGGGGSVTAGPVTLGT